MAYGGIVGQSFDDNAVKEYIDQQINELKQQISETSVKIVTGSYVGTGTYGEDNPNTLTFDFEPKVVMISRSDGSDSHGGILFIHGQLQYSQWGTYGGSAYGLSGEIEWEGNSVSWYSDKLSGQFNLANITYFFAAIG